MTGTLLWNEPSWKSGRAKLDSESSEPEMLHASPASHEPDNIKFI